MHHNRNYGVPGNPGLILCHTHNAYCGADRVDAYDAYGVPPDPAARRLVDARFTGPCMRMWRKIVQVRGVSSAPRCWVARE